MLKVIVLDTHVWLWWVEDDSKLKSAVRHLIDNESDLRVSAISMVEIITACTAGRLALAPDVESWLAIATSSPTMKIEPITASLCIEAFNLPDEFHRDPGDRLIVALARQLNADLITADHKILKYPGVKAVAAS